MNSLKEVLEIQGTFVCWRSMVQAPNFIVEGIIADIMDKMIV